MDFDAKWGEMREALLCVINLIGVRGMPIVEDVYAICTATMLGRGGEPVKTDEVLYYHMKVELFETHAVRQADFLKGGSVSRELCQQARATTRTMSGADDDAVGNGTCSLTAHALDAATNANSVREDEEKLGKLKDDGTRTAEDRVHHIRQFRARRHDAEITLALALERASLLYKYEALWSRFVSGAKYVNGLFFFLNNRMISLGSNLHGVGLGGGGTTSSPHPLVLGNVARWGAPSSSTSSGGGGGGERDGEAGDAEAVAKKVDAYQQEQLRRMERIVKMQDRTDCYADGLYSIKSNGTIHLRGSSKSSSSSSAQKAKRNKAQKARRSKKVHNMFLMAMTLWRKHVLAKFNKALCREALEYVARWRRGELVGDTSNSEARRQVQQFISSLQTVGEASEDVLRVYRIVFEDAFLKLSRDYFTRSSRDYVHTNGVAAYVSHVEPWLIQESSFADTMLPAATKPKLLRLFDECALALHVDILEQSWESFLIHRNVHALKSMLFVLERLHTRMEADTDNDEKDDHPSGGTATSTTTTTVTAAADTAETGSVTVSTSKKPDATTTTTGVSALQRFVGVLEAYFVSELSCALLALKPSQRVKSFEVLKVILAQFSAFDRLVTDAFGRHWQCVASLDRAMRCVLNDSVTHAAVWLPERGWANFPLTTWLETHDGLDRSIQDDTHKQSIAHAKKRRSHRISLFDERVECAELLARYMSLLLSKASSAKILGGLSLQDSGTKTSTIATSEGSSSSSSSSSSSMTRWGQQRQGGHAMASSTTVSDLEGALQYCVAVFKYLDNKDAFGLFYAKLLSKRLILATSVSDDIEQQVVNGLRLACAFNFTSKLKRMMQDMLTSDDLNANFQSWLTDVSDRVESVTRDLVQRCDADPPHTLDGFPTTDSCTWAAAAATRVQRIQFRAKVLSAGMWPQSAANALTLRYPEPLRTALWMFEKFYDGVHQGRELKWLPQFSQGDVKSHHWKRRYEFTCTTVQAAILFALNNTPLLATSTVEDQQDGDQQDEETMRPRQTVAQLMEVTGLSKAEVKRTVQGLVKVGIVQWVAHDAEQSVNTGSHEGKESEQVVAVAAAYKNPRLRVKISHVHAGQDAAKEHTQVKQHVAQDRKIFLEATIVRVMKARKELSHRELVGEVLEEASKRCKPKVALVKRCIESLIDKEYLKRTERDDGPGYQYLA